MRHRTTMWLAAAMLSLAFLVPTAAEASHFRFGLITHKPSVTPGAVDITVRIGYRGSYFGSPNIGATIPVDAVLDFGDASGINNPPMTVIARSLAEDWIIVERVFPKTYANAAGSYLVRFYSCCRIGALYNGSNGNYELRTRIAPALGNSSPVVSAVPVVFMPASPASTFQIVASDPNNNPLRYRIAIPAENGNVGGPTGLTINSTTGLITWVNNALPTANFYSVQVIVEDLDGIGSPITQTPVDFLLRIQNPIGNPPTIVANPAGPHKINPGDLLTFTVTGADTDANAVVSVANSGLPSGATMSPAHPMSGASPQVSTFSWTPTVGQEGDYSITYVATDENSNQALTTVQINVNNPPTADAGPDQVLECVNGAADVTMAGSGSDPDNDPITLSWYDASNALVGTGTAPVISVPNGTHVYTLIVSDGAASASSTVTITVEDTQAPTFTVVPSVQLWSPNHTYHRFTLSQIITSLSDGCDDVQSISTYITSVTSDEEEDAIGDGNTLDDMVIIDCQTVDLRAERAGMRNGRVYTVHFVAEDGSGNTTPGSYKVGVPKSMSSGPAVEDAVLYTVTSACPTSPKGGVRTAATAVTLDLGQNYPNPFNPSTTIRYALPVDGHASLRVFDMTGAEVAVLFSGVQAAGAYAVEFDASALPSGVYMYRLEQAGTTATKLMQLMK
jgi:hypothetical protein